MKLRILTVVACVAALLPSTVFAANTCEEKKEVLEKELKIAKGYSNSGRIRGLERALANVNTWCDNADLRDDAANKVREKEEKVRERQAELTEAVKGNDGAKKIAKRQKKLDEAQEELDEARAELEAFN